MMIRFKPAVPWTNVQSLDLLRKTQLDTLVEMRKIVGDAMSSIINDQASDRDWENEPLCEALTRATTQLMQDLLKKELWPWQKQRPCDLELILAKLEGLTLRMPSVHRADNTGSNCRLSTGLCSCEGRYSPSNMVKQIREKAAELRKRLEHVKIDF